MWYVYPMECYSAIKKHEIMLLATMQIDLEIVILTEINQTEKEKYHMLSFIFEI